MELLRLTDSQQRVQFLQCEWICKCEGPDVKNETEVLFFHLVCVFLKIGYSVVWTCILIKDHLNPLFRVIGYFN